MFSTFPGHIKFTDEKTGAGRMAGVSFGGTVKRICIDLIPEAEAGDYILSRAGFALCVIDKEESKRTAAAAKEIEIKFRTENGEIL